jgi:acyl-CoA reductase-like NAD-dependent aldehyde dehydrogenase
MTSWKNKSPGDLSTELPEVWADPVAPAVDRAVQASRSWGSTSLPDRIALLKSAQLKIEADQQKLAEGIALETGKP